MLWFKRLPDSCCRCAVSLGQYLWGKKLKLSSHPVAALQRLLECFLGCCEQDWRKFLIFT